METRNLIDRLSAEMPHPALRPARLAVWLIGMAGLCGALFLCLAGPRPDLGAALLRPLILSKTLLPALACLIALPLAARLARPGDRRRSLLPLAAPLLITVILWLVTFVTLPPDDRFADVSVAAVAECFGLILTLSALPLATGIAVFRQGASTRPTLCGALIGLASAAGAATGYSLFCQQDNPLFYLTWYTGVIFIVAACGALLGHRFLSW